MIQKLIYFAVILTSLLMWDGVWAQSADSGNARDQQISEARKMLQAGRVEILRAELPLTESESAEFWPAYDAYIADLKPVRDRHADLIGRYMRSYDAGAISDEFAEQLVNDYIAIKMATLEIQKKHLRQFRDALPPLKAALFYQLENRFESELQSQLAEVIPQISVL